MSWAVGAVGCGQRQPAAEGLVGRTHEVLPGEGAGNRCRAKGDAALLVGAVVETRVRLEKESRGPGRRPGRVPHAARPSCAACDKAPVQAARGHRVGRNGGVGAGGEGIWRGEG